MHRLLVTSTHHTFYRLGQRTHTTTGTHTTSYNNNNRHPGPGSVPFHIEVLNVGGWLTHCDFALDVAVDFLAVVEHRLIPARVRSEWSRLRCRKIASIWALASQESSHVGHAGVGVVSLRGAPLSLPSFATARFQSFFDCGRAFRCVLPLGGGRIMHLVVLYCYQGADRDLEQLALTDQLLDASLGELACVAREQPCLLVGDFNVEPTKIPCLAKGIMAGLWVDLDASWALASGRDLGVTCKQDFESSIGSRLDFMVGCPRIAAAVSGCGVLADRWVVPHFAVRSSFDYSRWLTRVSLLVRRSPLWPASWLPVLDKSRGSKVAEVQRVWDIYIYIYMIDSSLCRGMMLSVLMIL